MTTYMHLQADYIRLQALLHTVAGSIAYGCRLYCMRLQVRYAAEDARVGFELLLALHARCLPPLPLDAWVQRQLAAAPPRRPSKPATPPPPGRNSALGGRGGAPGGGGGDGAAPPEPERRLPGPYYGYTLTVPTVANPTR